MKLHEAQSVLNLAEKILAEVNEAEAFNAKAVAVIRLSVALGVLTTLCLGFTLETLGDYGLYLILGTTSLVLFLSLYPLQRLVSRRARYIERDYVNLTALADKMQPLDDGSHIEQSLVLLRLKRWQSRLEETVK